MCFSKDKGRSTMAGCRYIVSAAAEVKASLRKVLAKK
jgi:hypothetical protein